MAADTQYAQAAQYAAATPVAAGRSDWWLLASCGWGYWLTDGGLPVTVVVRDVG